MAKYLGLDLPAQCFLSSLKTGVRSQFEAANSCAGAAEEVIIDEDKKMVLTFRRCQANFLVAITS